VRFRGARAEGRRRVLDRLKVLSAVDKKNTYGDWRGGELALTKEECNGTKDGQRSRHRQPAYSPEARQRMRQKNKKYLMGCMASAKKNRCPMYRKMNVLRRNKSIIIAVPPGHARIYKMHIWLEACCSFQFCDREANQQ